MGIVETKRDKRNAVRSMVRRIFAVALLGVMILTSMYAYNFLTTAEAFNVKTVELSGIMRVEPDETARMLEDLKGQNILLAPLDAYEERLKMHPRIKRVTLRRVLPDKIKCSVEEREPVAVVYVDRFLEVDDSGMIMADDEYTPMLDLPIITGLDKEALATGKISEDKGLQGALEALRLCKCLGNGFASDISELRISHSGVTIRSLKDDRVLVLGEVDFENRLKKYFLLKQTLEDRDQTAQLIDLRFEDQVVLRGQL